MSGFVRSSHYRHVFVETPKAEETYKGFRLATTTGEQQYIKGNTKFFAVAVSGGGGPFAVVPYSAKGMQPIGAPNVSGHRGAVLDFDFNPFHPNLIASASEDTTIKVWGVPHGGLTTTITEPLVDLQGHQKKVTLLRFHPSANNVLASVSADLAVKVWDIEKGVESFSQSDAHTELIQDIVWDFEGKIWATSSKDKTLRLGDPRGNKIVQEVKEAHTGSKSVKLAFLGETGRFVSLGFTKQSQRQMKLWDQRDTSKPLCKIDIDQAAGVIMPYYDPDTKVLFLAGKGDGNIRYYEMTPKGPFAFPLSEYRSTSAAKGTCFIPKRACDVLKCETARCLKLTQKGTEGIIEPLSFIVPRKSDAFQIDIFPDTFSGVPSCTSDDWKSGVNKQPLKMSLNPADTGGSASKAANQPKAFAAVKSPAVLAKEVEVANARIKTLEARLSKAGLDIS